MTTKSNEKENAAPAGETGGEAATGANTTQSEKAKGRTFEGYLRNNGHPDGMEFSEFVLRVTADKKGSLNAFVRPNPHSGEAIGLTIAGNSVTLG